MTGSGEALKGRLEDSQLLEIYRRMVRIRRFEEQAESMLRAGEILGSLHSSAWQEAVCVGACMALRDTDYMTGNHRSHGHPIAKGSDVRHLMAELLGRSDGVCNGNGGSMHLADFSVGSLGESAIVGAGIPIAVGAGLASKLKGDDRICLAFFGDGATNNGIFHEALNFASIWSIPVVLLCENNQYAVSTHYRTTSAVERIAMRASAYGIPGFTIDGQDVLEVFDSVSAAADRCRRGLGPTLIEGVTYRRGSHSYGSARDLRTDEEIDEMLDRDPIALFAHRLTTEFGLSVDVLAKVDEDVKNEIEGAAEFARASAQPIASSLMTAMYSSPEPFLANAGNAPYDAHVGER